MYADKQDTKQIREMELDIMNGTQPGAGLHAGSELCPPKTHSQKAMPLHFPLG